MQPDRGAPLGVGRVRLVGAGPGSADLLTLRAVKAIESADVILFDALVGDDIRALFPDKARCVEVGKRGHRPSTSQDFINRLMLKFARTGAIVVRLKGGDPSIFGRAAEERAYLESHGVAVEVIPGITTASAAAAEFGFSLTTRAGARRVVLATGRTLDGASADWAAMADPANTLCLYMGCADIASISQQLIDAGMPPTTPALAALDVSRAGSRLLKSTIGKLADALSHERVAAPVFICIGTACAEAISVAREESLLPAQGLQAC